MLSPERKEVLSKYTKAVKAIIYDADRMRELAPLMDTRDGAVKAVTAIISTIEQKKAIPPEIKSLLAINTYILLVDMLQEIHGQKPDNQMVGQTILAIIKAMAQPKQSPQAVPRAQPMQPAGIIGGATA